MLFPPVTLGIGAALPLAVAWLLLRWHWHLNVRVRRRVLGDRTDVHALTTALHAVTFLRLAARKAPKDSPAVRGKVDAALAAVAQHGGTVCYVGHADETVVHCPPLTDGQGFDVVFLTSWPAGRAGHDAWRAGALAGVWSRHLSEGFQRNPVANIAANVVMLSALKLKTIVFGERHDVSKEAPGIQDLPAFEPPTLGGGGGDTSVTYRRDGDGGGGVVDAATRVRRLRDMAEAVRARGAPGDGVMIFNLLNGEGSPDADKKADLRYSRRMMEMLRSHGGGLMHFGPATALGGGAADNQDDGTWRTVAAVHYPGRAFFAQLVKSAWMFDVSQGKKPGKSIAVLTTPYFPTAEDAVCLRDYGRLRGRAKL